MSSAQSTAVPLPVGPLSAAARRKAKKARKAAVQGRSGPETERRHKPQNRAWVLETEGITCDASEKRQGGAHAPQQDDDECEADEPGDFDPATAADDAAANSDADPEADGVDPSGDSDGEEEASARPAKRGAGQAPLHLEGTFQDGVLYLLHRASGAAFSPERDAAGDLVRVGKWDGATSRVRLLKRRPAPAAPPQSPAAPAAPPRMSKAERRALGAAAAAAAAAERSRVIAHPFESDPLDHCETAPEAFSHIAPLLRLLAAALGKSPGELRIYDPYYCDGSSARHLAALGFPLVHNRNEDCYAVRDRGEVPEHDVLVTNPPYSGDHPKRCVRFAACQNQGRPWLLLMPAWVAHKPWYPNISGLASADAPAAAPGGAPAPRQLFVVPHKRYNYWTPKPLSQRRLTDATADGGGGGGGGGEGGGERGGGGEKRKRTHTGPLGERTSPFSSFWLCNMQGLVSRKAVERRLVLDGAAARLLTKLGECPRADRDGGHHW